MKGRADRGAGDCQAGPYLPLFDPGSGQLSVGMPGQGGAKVGMSICTR
jgi:hypothetical protein